MKRIDVFETEKILKIGQCIEITRIGTDDDREEVYTSRIEDIKGDDVFLALPLDDRLRPVIPAAGQPVAGRIIDRDCAYSFEAQYKSTAKIGIPVWIIKISPTVVKFQNREFVRIKITIPLKITIANKDGSLGIPFKTDSIDVSGNGISFFSPQKISPDGRIIIETGLIPSVGRINTFAEIKRCTLIKDKTQYLTGSMFVNLSTQTQNKLIRYLFTKQREFINKGINLK